MRLHRSFHLWREKLREMGVEIECPAMDEFDHVIMDMYGVPKSMKVRDGLISVYYDMVLWNDNISELIKELRMWSANPQSLLGVDYTLEARPSYSGEPDTANASIAGKRVLWNRRGICKTSSSPRFLTMQFTMLA